MRFPDSNIPDCFILIPIVSVLYAWMWKTDIEKLSFPPPIFPYIHLWVVFSSGMCVWLHFFQFLSRTAQNKNVMWVMYTLICSLTLFLHKCIFSRVENFFCVFYFFSSAWIRNKLSENIFVHFFLYSEIFFIFIWNDFLRSEVKVFFYVQSWSLFLSFEYYFFCECLTEIFFRVLMKRNFMHLWGIGW